MYSVEFFDDGEWAHHMGDLDKGTADLMAEALCDMWGYKPDQVRVVPAA